MIRSMPPVRLSTERFAELVNEALASVPQEFRAHLDNVSVEVQDRPDRRTLSSVKLSRRELLLGVYQGVPLTRKSVSAPYDWPERILIFQRNIEACCRSEREVVEQVRRTVLHEIAHHFGMDEGDLRELGCG